MKILLVEDEDGIGVVLNKLLGPIRERYPGAVVAWEKTMEGARKHLRTIPLPAVIVWDLLLPDSTLPMTVAAVRTIHPFSPSVIFTGQDRSVVIRELQSDTEQIAVIEKHDTDWPSRLLSAMCNALTTRVPGDKADTIAELREIIAGLKEKGYAHPEPTQPARPV